MIRARASLWLTLGLIGVAALSVAYALRSHAAHHYERGYAARSAEVQAALDQAQAKLDAVAEVARARAVALAAAETETQSLLEALANEADLDPDGIRLSADSVRRLNAVAGHPPPRPAPR